MASGIKDRVAILGMGCARFGDRWSDDAETLMVEALDVLRQAASGAWSQATCAQISGGQGEVLATANSLTVLPRAVSPCGPPGPCGRRA